MSSVLVLVFDSGRATLDISLFTRTVDLVLASQFQGVDTALVKQVAIQLLRSATGKDGVLGSQDMCDKLAALVSRLNSPEVDQALVTAVQDVAHKQVRSSRSYAGFSN